MTLRSRSRSAWALQGNDKGQGAHSVRECATIPQGNVKCHGGSHIRSLRAHSTQWTGMGSSISSTGWPCAAWRGMAGRGGITRHVSPLGRAAWRIPLCLSYGHVKRSSAGSCVSRVSGRGLHSSPHPAIPSSISSTVGGSNPFAMRTGDSVVNRNGDWWPACAFSKRVKVRNENGNAHGIFTQCRVRNRPTRRFDAAASDFRLGSDDWMGRRTR
jgi:hypothetical protein